MRRRLVVAVVVLLAIGLAGGIGYHMSRANIDRDYVLLTHRLERIPEKVTTDTYEVVPGLRLVMRGLSIEVVRDKIITGLAPDEDITFTYFDPIDRTDEEVCHGRDGYRHFAFVDTDFSSEKRASFHANPYNLCPDRDKSGHVVGYTNYISVELEKGGARTESNYFEVTQHPWIVYQDKLVVASDRMANIPEQVAMENLRAVSRLTENVNGLIQDTVENKMLDDVMPISEIYFVDFVSDLVGKHHYSTLPDEGTISGSTQELGDRRMLLAGVLHEETHMIVHNLYDADKTRLERAFSTFRVLAGFKPTDRLSSALLGPADVAENSPIFGVVDEDEVYQMGKEKYGSTGHPYDNPSEMMASAINAMTYAPDRVEELLRKLPPEKAAKMRAEVLRPCVAILGDKWGPRIMGPSYDRFK